MEMKYALNLAPDGRILSATFPKYAPEDAVVVDELPEGNIYEYRYDDGFVYDPLPVPEQPEEVPLEDRMRKLEETLGKVLSVLNWNKT